ncbi:SymE family type I addiction module toxin [Proteus mirabilis]|nr:SymE family type I addiction module toxin [Proteus mirabilis]
MHKAIFLRDEWIEQAGFTDRMQVKIRVMPDCIVITTQNSRELWGCAEGLSVTHVNRPKMLQWFNSFPGAFDHRRSAGDQTRERAFWVSLTAGSKIPALGRLVIEAEFKF